MKDADFGGSYNDLADKPTIPAAQVNADWSANSGVAEILNKPTLGTAAALNIPASGDAATTEVVKGDDSRLSDARTPTSHTHTTSEITDFPTIPSAPGTLVTNATTAQTASAGEAMSGTIKLHKVAKTGTYSDLIGIPTIPSAPGTLDTTQTTAQSTNASEALSGSIKLHKISKTGAYSDLIGKPTIPDAVSGVNDGTNWTSITIGNETKGIPSGGGGGLTDYDFTELSAPTISGGACTITFAANQRNGVEFSTNADLSIALVSNNKSDNYMWITNSHATTAIDITFSSIMFGSTAINDIKGTASIPSVEAGETLEIGIYVTDTKARITSRIL